jgi:hypothetical protein
LRLFLPVNSAPRYRFGALFFWRSQKSGAFGTKILAVKAAEIAKIFGDIDPFNLISVTGLTLADCPSV